MATAAPALHPARTTDLAAPAPLRAVPVRVGAISAEDPASPAIQVRTVLPRAALARHGVALEQLSLFTAAGAERFRGFRPAQKLRAAARAHGALAVRLADADIDVALVHRRVDLFPTLALERRAIRGRRLVYDVDDPIWLDVRPDSGTHPLAVLKGSARKVRWLAERADHVIAGNPLLADHLERYGTPVSVVPSLVDTKRVPLRRHADAPELVLGWIGSRTTAPFVETLRRALTRLAAALPGGRLRLVMVGGAVPPVTGIAHEARPWTAEAHRDALSRLDVGLMPLPDTAWNRGKCAYKALQYMGAGVPVVADDVGIAADVVGHADAGYVVGTEDEWVDALAALLADPALRGRLGAHGRARVARDFSLDRWAPRLAQILRGGS